MNHISAYIDDRHSIEKIVQDFIESDIKVWCVGIHNNHIHLLVSGSRRAGRHAARTLAKILPGGYSNRPIMSRAHANNVREYILRRQIEHQSKRGRVDEGVESLLWQGGFRETFEEEISNAGSDRFCPAEEDLQYSGMECNTFRGEEGFSEYSPAQCDSTEHDVAASTRLSSDGTQNSNGRYTIQYKVWDC